MESWNVALVLCLVDFGDFLFFFEIDELALSVLIININLCMLSRGSLFVFVCLCYIAFASGFYRGVISTAPNCYPHPFFFFLLVNFSCVKKEFG